MSLHPATVERAAFAIYTQFICGGYPTRQMRDGNGRPATDLDGRPFMETPAEAAARRWLAAPELTRERFRNEAIAALEAA
ncbi:hypothetical protein NL532_24215 [Mesorhizobium sp. C120A]|uniref:hypothetical protein n=1 Tax=unclassified Mesorhizobium TaxID=325217 RepID=UPI0003CFA06B|nr:MULTISPECIES: hypothetical protein [unclassified Mesorhizobium]ESZ60671.1 hypothetical protein X728_15165 [Mesorhizobium sp. L103C120A0]WJI43715.1 hypothetical protein NL532_24215 [Mesorhizobium sp. C120A]